MYERDVGVYPRLLLFVPNKYKIREIGERAVDVQPWMFDNLKTLRMCERAF